MKERIRVQAYFKEFDWLKKYVEPEDVGSVKVGRINGDMINSRSRIYKSVEWADPLGGSGVTNYEDEWLLINHHGDLCCKLGTIVHERKPNYKWWKPSTWGYTEYDVPESLSDALVRLGDKSGDVTYLLVLKPQENRPEIRIYKSPKNFTLKDWVGQLRQQAENTVKQQIAAAEKEVKKEVESV